MVESGGVAISAEEVRRGEHGARLQAAVPVDQQRVPLHVQVLLGRSIEGMDQTVSQYSMAKSK